MRILLTAVVLSALLATRAQSEEPAKIKIAVVRLDFINNGIMYDKLSMLSRDKEMTEATKTIRLEIRKTVKKIIDAKDEESLTELGKKMELLNQKMTLLQQWMTQDQQKSNPQLLIRKFVVRNFKDKYPIILQDLNCLDRAFWKGDIEIVDITDEVISKFNEYLEKITDE